MLKGRCYLCRYCDIELHGCMYIDRNKDNHTRGQIVSTIYGRKIIYPDPCDKWEPRNGTTQTLPAVVNGRKVRRTRKVKGFPERLELYEQGLTDPEIAKRLGLNTSAISNWRHRRHLPSNAPQAPNEKKVYPEREKLYKEGLCDAEIALRLGVNITAIRQWRYGLGYAANRAPKKETPRPVYPEREKMYAEGLCDKEIAERSGVSVTTIIKWRQSLGLPNVNMAPRKPKEFPERRELYALGLTDEEIAARLGVSKPTINKWRNRLGLPANRKKGDNTHDNQRQSACAHA